MRSMAGVRSGVIGQNIDVNIGKRPLYTVPNASLRRGVFDSVDSQTRATWDGLGAYNEKMTRVTERRHA